MPPLLCCLLMLLLEARLNLLHIGPVGAIQQKDEGSPAQRRWYHRIDDGTIDAWIDALQEKHGEEENDKDGNTPVELRAKESDHREGHLRQLQHQNASEARDGLVRLIGEDATQEAPQDVADLGRSENERRLWERIVEDRHQVDHPEGLQQQVSAEQARNEHQDIARDAEELAHIAPREGRKVWCLSRLFGAHRLGGPSSGVMHSDQRQQTSYTHHRSNDIVAHTPPMGDIRKLTQ